MIAHESHRSVTAQSVPAGPRIPRFRRHTRRRPRVHFAEYSTGTRNQARAAGKPWIVSECCNPAAGSTYEMSLPVLRELEVGYTVWQLIIGRDQFRSASGLVYPDGTVRRIAEVEAVMNSRVIGFQEKPDEQGVPHQHDIPLLLAEHLEASVKVRRDRTHTCANG